MNFTSEYEAIEVYLKKEGLSWIFEQVKEQIEIGKFAEQKISTLREDYRRGTDLFGKGSFQRSQPAEFVKRNEYSEKEKLILLIEALGRAIIEPLLMEEKVVEFFKDYSQEVKLCATAEEVKTVSTKRLPEEFERARSAGAALDKLVREIGEKND